MKYELSQHALIRIRERRIEIAWLEQAPFSRNEQRQMKMIQAWNIGWLQLRNAIIVCSGSYATRGRIQ